TTHSSLAGALMPTSTNMIIYAFAAQGITGTLNGQQMSGVSIGETTKVAWPYYLAIFSAINLVTYFPFFSTWLPSVINGHP
ncbi:hypothetical protein AB4Y33_43345, partial [Paraburkholderia sp. BR14319]